MNIFDILIGAMVFIGCWRGLMAGMVKTSILLVAWFMALALASKFASILAPLFVNISQSDIAQIVLSFVCIVCGVMLFAHLIIWIFSKTLKILRLGLLDRLLGGALGACIGLLKVLIVLSVVSPILINFSSYQNAILVERLLPFAPIAKMLVVQKTSDTWEHIQNY